MHNEIMSVRRGEGKEPRESTQLKPPPMEGNHDRNERNLRDQHYFPNSKQPRAHVPNIVVMIPLFEDAEILDQVIPKIEYKHFRNDDAPEMVDASSIATEAEDPLEEEIPPRDNVVQTRSQVSRKTKMILQPDVRDYLRHTVQQS